ncbi:hypothetical protein BDV38DRAFT_243165 [Aspergillus pseudotamarii]|uniref:Uncharacterized protein n=1 Tax=Aspergillus pseudotamarii TaxID=132259 RepID=A0A5N6T0X6_ASPPS|nr:uncharacterized protein BDV38DRAFT_243165 [Aspergillus pseudotamarii]KAE8139274.1 hypothetical protein BDV38DRAFT_243165 [Aspergillus pseudotamarii]
MGRKTNLICNEIPLYRCKDRTPYMGKLDVGFVLLYIWQVYRKPGHRESSLRTSCHMACECQFV